MEVPGLSPANLVVICGRGVRERGGEGQSFVRDTGGNCAQAWILGGVGGGQGGTVTWLPYILMSPLAPSPP